MKCFYHPVQDAVGTCNQCGKCACHECLREVNGGMFCKGCIARELKAVETEKQQIRETQEAVVARARRRIRTSKIVFAIFFILCVLEIPYYLVVVARAGQLTVGSVFLGLVGGAIAAVFSGYSAWSFYWGIPAIWGGIKRVFSKVPFFVILGPVEGFIEFFVLLFVLMFLGEFYCLFGGGWSQYRKRVRVVRGEARAAVAA